VGGLVELVLVAGPVLVFAIYELVKLKRDKNPAKISPPGDRKS
jgi:hypothetical protein